MEKMDRLWPEGYAFLFDDALFQPSTDSFLLGDFVRTRRGDRVCDLGAGTGLLGLLLLARQPELSVTDVEIQEAAGAAGLSVNAWIGQVIEAALQKENAEG